MFTGTRRDKKKNIPAGLLSSQPFELLFPADCDDTDCMIGFTMDEVFRIYT
jgi:hypothetical protein